AVTGAAPWIYRGPTGPRCRGRVAERSLHPNSDQAAPLPEAWGAAGLGGGPGGPECDRLPFGDAGDHLDGKRYAHRGRFVARFQLPCRQPLALKRRPSHPLESHPMKTGMNLLLWTGHVTAEHFPLLARLKKAGFDGVEVPLFEGNLAHFKMVGEELDNLGL